MNIIKVKKLRSGAFKNNKLLWILVGTVATIFLLIFLKAWLNRSKGEGVSETLTSVFTSDEIVKGKGPTASEPMSPEAIKKANNKVVMRVIRERLAQKKAGYKGQQEKLKDYFQQLAQLKINLPGHLHYSTVDPEEGIGGIYGTSVNGDESFAVLATRKPVTMKEITTFLQEGNSSLPMLKNHKLLPDKIFTEKAPEETGLASITVIPMSENGNMGLFAVFAPRTDGKGSYLFIREGDKNTFESNDGYYDQMLEEMRAQP